MPSESIEQDFHAKVSRKIRVVSEGIDRYRVLTPFRFDDGDHFVVVLKKDGPDWVLSDEAHTYMHLTYDIDEKDLHRGTRQKIITNALSVHQVSDRDGELLIPVEDEQYGDALYSFVQAVLRISDVTFLSRERVQSTFLEDFKQVFIEYAPEDRRTFEWSHPDHDPHGIYPVDCRINGMDNPLLIHALNSDDKTRDATIALLQFERWGMEFRSLAIFEDQESINRKVLARFTDVCEKQFSSLGANRERIETFVRGAIS